MLSPLTTVRIGLAQMNSTVGDLAGNTERIIATLREADVRGCHIVAFPELAVTGAPLEDLALKPALQRESLRCIERIAEAQAGLSCAAVVGFVEAADEQVNNAAAVIAGGRVAGIQRKLALSNGDARFATGTGTQIFNFGAVNVGVGIGDDAWLFEGATVLLSIAATPFVMDQWKAREALLGALAKESAAFICSVNAVGGHDDLLFDGRSLVFGPDGQRIARGPTFEEALLVADLPLAEFSQRRDSPRREEEHARLASLGLDFVAVDLPPFETASDRDAPVPDVAALPVLLQPDAEPLETVAEVWKGLVLALRDYVRKNGFTDVALGLSGGIDSALVAALAVEALGREHVVGVTMPSRFSSEGTKSDADQLAENLGIRYFTLPIEGPYAATLEAIAPATTGTTFGVAEENLQARIRGNYLMTLSNKFGWLILTTGNKSETAVGYATLYGDMAGGFAVLKDVPKTLVFALSRYANRNGEVIPETTITRPPSAELRPDQQDTDSLPPYEILDGILRLYVEEGRDPREIAGAGYDIALVRRVTGMVDRAEYKRRQAPPGPKITARAFGTDRRLPLTSAWRDA